MAGCQGRLRAVLIAVALIILCYRSAGADEPRRKVGLLLELVQGVAFPAAMLNQDMGGGEGTSRLGYQDLVGYASYKIGARFGVILSLGRSLALAPEIELDFLPYSDVFSSALYDKTTHMLRERALAGARLILPFAKGAAYARFAVGVDHLHGNISAGTSFGIAATSLTWEPGAGVEFKLGKRFVLGGSIGFPFAAFDFGSPYAPKFTAFDVDLLVVGGMRL
jgi:hypothetical protein